MSVKIKPDERIDVDDRTIERYGLPEGGETVLWVEVGEDSYSAKWMISDNFGAEDQLDALNDMGYEFSPRSVMVDSEERRKLPAGVARVGDDLSHCTYLRVELDSFDLEWLPGDYSNRVVYSSTFDDGSLEEIFYLFESTEGLGLDSVNKALEDLEQILERSANESSGF